MDIIVVAEEAHFFGRPHPQGERLRVRPVVGEALMEQGIAVIVEPDGSIRRRRGRPARDEERIIAAALGRAEVTAKATTEPAAGGRKRRYSNRMLKTET